MITATADDVKKLGQVRERLPGCSTKEDIDGLFNQFGITDFPRKTTLLRQSMQIQEILDIPHDQELSDEDAYEEELEFFLAGKWRDLI